MTSRTSVQLGSDTMVQAETGMLRKDALKVTAQWGVYSISMVAFLLKAIMRSLSQTFHPEADVRLGHAGSQHVHDATFWLALQ